MTTAFTSGEAKRLVDKHLEEGRKIQADLEGAIAWLEAELPKMRRELERVRVATGEAWREGDG